MVGGQWRCVVCTLVNEANAKSCEACNKPRPKNRPAHASLHSPSGLNSFMNFGKTNINVYVDDDDDDDDDDDGQVNINASGNGGYSNGDEKHDSSHDVLPVKAPTDAYGNIISSQKDFENACSDIVACNSNPSPVFNTLKSVSRKLTKDDVRYRTLDLQNPRVVERLIGFEGVLDFLTLLGFQPDENGIKLVCEKKPSVQVIKNAVEVLASYENKLGFTKKKKRDMQKMGRQTDQGNDLLSDSGNGGVTAGGPNDNGIVGIDISTVNNDEEDSNMSIDQIIAWGTHEYSRDAESINTLIMTHVGYTDSLLSCFCVCLICFW